MTDHATYRGRLVKPLPNREAALDRIAACENCGVRLSRYNPGPLCHPCDARHGEIRKPRIRGRSSPSPTG